jgi:hypothetical protein
MTMKEIGAAIELGQRGEREGALAALAGLWADTDQPLLRCAIAHAAADLQDDPRDELTWDLRALDASAAIRDDDVAAAGMPGTTAAMLPSLHLNVGEDYRKLGDLDAARRHQELGTAATPGLPDDGYGRMIRGGLKRLSERLATRAHSCRGEDQDPGAR